MTVSSPQRLAVDKTDPHRFASASKDANKSKNRYVNVLPCELLQYNVCCTV